MMKTTIFILQLLLLSENLTAGLDKKTYIFALRERHFAKEYATIDVESGEIEGFTVDLIKEVCRRADKSCDFYWLFGVERNHCWDQDLHYSAALWFNWFDSCVGYVAVPEMTQVVHTYGEHIRLMAVPALLANEQNKHADPATSKVGFVKHFATSPRCLQRAGIDVGEVVFYPNVPAQLQAIQSGEVTMGFNNQKYAEGTNLTVVQGPIHCTGDAYHIILIARHEMKSKLRWFDEYLDEMKEDGSYRDMCEKFVKYSGKEDLLQCL